MEMIRVPVFPVDKENEVVEDILKSAGENPLGSTKPDYKRQDVLEDLKLVLHAINMDKYIDVFLKSNLTLQMFLQLNESDLIELGISDAKDIETIARNIRIFEAKQRKYKVPESPQDDLKIARNVYNELVLLQNYCSYLELQLRKNKLTDYRINWKESASTYLKAFTETASLQAKILSQRLFSESGSNHLIGKALKLNNLVMSKSLQESLKKKHPKGRLKILKVALIIGIFSLGVLVKKFL